jgi:2-polyprenyl-3-methyl-5-hydroxy-6-metoxy-1,4-benzoquinol methylase
VASWVDVERAWDDLQSTHYVRMARAYLCGRDPSMRQVGPEGFRKIGATLARFKRTIELPRVRKVISILRAIRPESLLDVGSGRGVSLWPILDLSHEMARNQGVWDQKGYAFDVFAGDISARHARSLGAVARGNPGGFIQAEQMDAKRLPYEADFVDVVTILEVLEHLGTWDDVRDACSEALRVADRFVIASVPSKPDDNPDHHRVFTPHRLAESFMEVGAQKAKTEHVLNHIVVLVKK